MSEPSPSTDNTAITAARRRRARGCRPDSTRNRILSAAEALFAEHGLHATTTEKIAQRARVSSGVLFYYFATKDDLFVAVLEERGAVDVLKADLVAALRAAQHESPRTALTAVGLAFVTALQARDRAVRILLRELPTDRRAARHLRVLWSYAAGLITRYLRRVMAPTTLPIDQAARMFVSDLMVACAMDRVFAPERLVAAAVSVLFEGRPARVARATENGSACDAFE